MKTTTKYQSAVTVLSVEIKPGFKHESISFNDKKYGRSMLSERTTSVKCLLINFTDKEGNKGYFFSPTAEIVTVDGFLNYTYLCDKKTTWFKEIKGETIGHKNILAYPGGTEPGVILENRTTIEPTIKQGDEIQISGAIKKVTGGGLLHLFRVKLIKA